MSRHFVITGASRGIGLELCRQALAAGNPVSALARMPEESEGLKRLQADFPGKIELHRVDVSSGAEISTFAKKLGPGRAVDVLINNAGAYLDGDEDFSDLPLENVSQSFESNTIGPMRMVQALLPNLEKSAAPKVLNMTSLMGSIGDNSSGGSYGYRMSKCALNMFTKTFALDFPSIVALTLHPGWVQTRMGGGSAPTPVEESVRGILRVLERAKPADSGKFYDYEGDELPW